HARLIDLDKEQHSFAARHLSSRRLPREHLVYFSFVVVSTHPTAIMSNFNDINYLTGRRMQRNHNDAIADKDRAQHLKRSLKRHRKEDDRDDLYRDDANMYTKILRGRTFTPIRPNSNNKQRRVTTEPDLDIFGNEVHRQYPNRGIFGNSK